jgi:hypothetical protein
MSFRVAQQPDCKQLAAMMDTGKHLASIPCLFNILKIISKVAVVLIIYA